ncbi:MAG: 4-(cytidine 5'-diphospho)-2-C-methyl-D-erythritol kinase [Prevotella sp.]|jgi:4-diphosphocytidyl-2-C-methyl-D-erythritol kinase|nr:4-(cytidine 5'-diphospho)-2-C-methyl-D-erythritol kinase [Prevotella sp.]
MICFPNAKINLGLNIVSKRADGYHNLETIFYPVGIRDALEIIIREEQSGDTFIEAGIKVDAQPENNLVMKALKLMRARYRFPPVEVHLLKKIPFGAGLGGGSSDASFMLRLLDRAFDLKISDEELAALAAQLGADCPFFIYNRPVFANGTGDIFEEIDLSLKGYYIVLVKPRLYVSTKDAFAGIKPRLPRMSLKEIVKRPFSDWKELMANDFEESVFAGYPLIGELKEDLYGKGAMYASMTGSGASVFGIFKEKLQSAETLYRDCLVWQGQA